jgi:hypothetical protein
MPTWLDQWCVGMRHRRRQELNAVGRVADQYCRHDGLAAREAALDTFREALRREELGEDVPLGIAFVAMFAQYFIVDNGVPLVRAYQLSAELADEIEASVPTPESVADTRAQIGEGQSFFIDIPSGVIGVGQAAELRAIFIEPWIIDLYEPGPNGETEERVLRYCAVVTPRGQYGWRHMIWNDDRSACVTDNVRIHDGTAVERGMPTFNEFLRQANLPVERLQDEVERIAYVTLEWARNPQRAGAEYMPQLPANHPRRAPGRDAEVRDRFSLFKIQRLIRRAPRIAQQPDDNQRQPWQLGRRITVRAHWRRQPVGPRGGDRRRWTLIREHHKGPVDGLPIHPMRRVAP